MSFLRLHDVVQTVFLLLQGSLTPDGLYQIAHHGVELMRECLMQICVADDCLEHRKVLDFMREALLQLKGLLLGGDPCAASMEQILDLPLPRMSRDRYSDASWRSVHPRKLIHKEDAGAALHFLKENQRFFEGEPWHWLEHFLESMSMMM